MPTHSGMNKLSVTIVALDEERNIGRCLSSVEWADEIVVVDTGSTDRTVDICKDHGCRVITSKWLGFGPTKRLAVESVSNEWVLSIDADEEVSPELKSSIREVLADPKSAGYRIKRTSFYMNTRIKHGGWNRDYPLRLFSRAHGNFNSKLVHESVVVDGAVERIEAPLVHYTYPTIESHIAKINRYAELGAQELLDAGESATILSAVLRGAVKFIKMYIVRLGFMDGRPGFVLASNSAFGVYLKYLKLWEKRRSLYGAESLGQSVSNDDSEDRDR
jgi:glycosyltransferase involved in cell wall biosynthesis